MTDNNVNSVTDTVPSTTYDDKSTVFHRLYPDGQYHELSSEESKRLQEVLKRKTNQQKERKALRLSVATAILPGVIQGQAFIWATDDSLGKPIPEYEYSSRGMCAKALEYADLLINLNEEIE